MTVARTTPVLASTHRVLAAVTAVLACAVSLAAYLSRSAVYGDETTDLSDAAIAQDLVTACVVAPLLLIAMMRASRGSSLAHLVGLGSLAFLAYNYAIYCFSISFGPLFLLWTTLLGLSSYALVWGFRHTGELDLGRVRSTPLAAGTLMIVSIMFTALWLSEIVPDIAHGRASTSAALWEVPTNPVHVLDLALFLPAAFLAGGWMLARRRSGLILGPCMLTFLALTSLPIIVTPFVTAARSGDAVWGAVAPVTVVAVVSVGALLSMNGKKS